MRLFKRQGNADHGQRKQALAGLGTSGVALLLAAADAALLPPAGVLVVVDGAGRARRVHTALAGKTPALPGGEDERVFCFHPGPYSIDLTPFAAAPELGLHLQFAIDAADPRVAQQRFDLYLASEVAAELTLAQFGAALQGAVQAALAQGNLDLPPCTGHDEWDAFRAGLNQLLYTRFGVTVDDCLPVDLGARVDFAALLAARAQVATPQPALAPSPSPSSALAAPAAVAVAAAAAALAPVSGGVERRDASALRRLFLELPAVTSGLRVIALPAGQPLFLVHQQLLQRLDLALLEVSTMTALAWAAPDQKLAVPQQQRRAGASAGAVAALDEAWALLARLQLAGAAHLPALLDEADRVLANLALALEQRRAPHGALDGAFDGATPIAPPQRREPK